MALLDQSWEDELYKYITGIVKQKNHLLVAINGHRDHVHILINMRPTCILSDLVREIKKSSNEFVNNRKFTRGRFSWQEGFGAFSYSRWDVDMITNYVRNQKVHHQKQSFRDEYVALLKEFHIDYDERYVFKPVAEEAIPEY